MHADQTDDDFDFGDRARAKAKARKMAEEARGKERPPMPPLRIIEPVKLAGVAVPPRRWVVEDWIPIGHVTLLYGDGGVGKTLLAQQLLTSCAHGWAWLGMAVTKCRVFGLFCEDSEEELHRRQDDILRGYQLQYEDLENVRWASGVGLDNTLVTFGSDGIAEATERLEEITRAAVDFGAQLVVIDTAADTFGGNENDRRQVRQYLGYHLGALAKAINGGVLLTAHPSRSGLSSTGDLDGGSTAWSNSARSRLALARPAGDDGEPLDPDARVLSRRKGNYAQIGVEMQLRWQKGVLVRERSASISGLAGANQMHEVEAVFLQLLDKCIAAGIHLSHSRNAGNFAPKIMSKRADRGGFSGKELEGAMHRLFEHGTIAVREYDRFHHKAIVRAIDQESPDGASDTVEEDILAADLPEAEAADAPTEGGNFADIAAE